MAGAGCPATMKQERPEKRAPTKMEQRAVHTRGTCWQQPHEAVGGGPTLPGTLHDCKPLLGSAVQAWVMGDGKE